MKITRHADPLNMRASFVLNGIHDGDKQVLVDLFSSDLEIDRQTRDALVEALKRRDGIRLELVRANGRPASFTARLRTMHEYQEIADEVAALMKAGDVPKAAKSKVMERRGIGEAKLKKALRYRRSHSATITYRPNTDA